ncbi:MAG: methyltransferase domain-containing protein [Thermodesulfovibrionales bacterium]|nr:methyltransferase domain-containing protein [Thermodesulfovibrionales bacterium]
MQETAIDKKKVAEYWSHNLSGTDAFSPLVYWLAVPEVQRRYQRRSVDRTCYENWVEYCIGEFLSGKTPVEKCLSLGCGTGWLERQLARLNIFKICEAYDCSPVAIDIARRESLNMGANNIYYEVKDIEKCEFTTASFDVVWFNGSLHHIKELERVCEMVKRSLKPDGYLFFNEYVGPSRFSFTERQKAVIRAAYELIPLKFRRSFIKDYPHEYLMTPPLPDPTEVILSDPSEAIRSDEIMNIVGKYFRICKKNNCGGTILQFLLSGICGNFTKDDPDSIKILNMLFAIEDALIDTHDIQSDFVVVVAQPQI